MPSFLIATQFLGQACGVAPTAGVNPAMRERLQSADSTVRAIYDALEPARRIDPWTGQGNATFSQWAGAFEPHVCWRPHAGHHSAGSAIDLSPAVNLHIGTRGAALAVYDRAMQFMTPSLAAADVRSRQPNETTLSVWTRFKAVSDALATYLSFAVDARASEVSRVAIPNVDELSDEELLAAIPETERLPLNAALARLEGHLSSRDFGASHPGWSNNSRVQYLRILRDYEHVRIPAKIDSSAAASRTRNPARGFLHLRSEIATALCDNGLRWGACDLETEADGSSGNGAMMHFDIADDEGYPEIHSLLRFG
jgi:hypothetical protein